LISFIWIMYNLRIKSMLLVYEPEFISAIGFEVLIHEHRNLPNNVNHKHEDRQTFSPY
jgi:hypothetical protein